jgi:aminopeptidase N
MINTITSSASGAVYLSDSDLLSVSRIFNGRLTYYKGAMVLNMLRLKLGDKLFFQGIKKLFG